MRKKETAEAVETAEPSRMQPLEMKVELTFFERILGTANSNPEIHRDYIASKAPDAKTKEEEVEELGVDEVEKKDMTVFPRLEDGRPFLYDYQIKGFLKNAARMLKKVPGSKVKKIPAHIQLIDGLIFIKERKIPLEFEGEVGNLQRPLRASTAQGERVALANSETCPEGTRIAFTFLLLDKSTKAVVEEFLDYGKLNGIGQWDNGGFGRFEWKEIA